MLAQSHIRYTVAGLGLATVFTASVARAATATNPCTLLSASEAQIYVGALTVPVFRADDGGAADTHGSSCAYRGSGGKQISLKWNASGAAEAGSITDPMLNSLGGTFEKAGQTGLAANAHRVIAQGPAGPWDKAKWIPGGTLFVTKGDQGVNVDMSGASGSETEAVAIARLAVPRFNHPLAYDGARAAINAPKSEVHAGPCAVVTQAVVEASIGPLAGVPTASADGSSCAYQVASPQGRRTYSVEYVWQGGLKNYNMLKNGSATLGSAMGGNIPMGSLDSLPQDAQTSALIGGLMKMAGGGDASAATAQMPERNHPAKAAPSAPREQAKVNVTLPVSTAINFFLSPFPRKRISPAGPYRNEPGLVFQKAAVV